jgi:hypothetical protein
LLALTSTPPARARKAPQKESPGGVDTEPDDHGLGRSHGGLTTKLHLAVEQGQRPLSLLVTAGHRHDSPQFQPGRALDQKGSAPTGPSSLPPSTSGCDVLVRRQLEHPYPPTADGIDGLTDGMHPQFGHDPFRGVVAHLSDADDPLQPCSSNPN